MVILITTKVIVWGPKPLGLRDLPFKCADGVILEGISLLIDMEHCSIEFY
jgi:hypothetical protein